MPVPVAVLCELVVVVGKCWSIFMNYCQGSSLLSMACPATGMVRLLKRTLKLLHVIERI
jgi:hypothetical protein